MSDPVSNAEIEDVLSSIRRLVSNGDRDKSHVSSGATKESADKLVLTPALRVDASQDVGDTESHHAENDPGLAAMSDRFEFHHVPQEDEAATGDREQEPASLQEDDVQAEDGMTPEASDEDTPSETLPEAEHHDSAEGSDEPALHEHVSDIGETDAEHHGDTPSAEQGPQHDEESSDMSALEDRIAEVEDAVAARQDEWEPDGDSEDPYSGSEVTPMAWEDYGPEPQHEQSEPVMRGPALVYASPDTDPADTVDQPITEDHDSAAISARVADPGEGSEKARDNEAALWSDDGDAIIDEETLRDMVSEIVRQELQGALGERITRNVRKLVRREIHRALTSQEFD
jgi:hypothetical protein